MFSCQRVDVLILTFQGDTNDLSRWKLVRLVAALSPETRSGLDRAWSDQSLSQVQESLSSHPQGIEAWPKLGRPLVPHTRFSIGLLAIDHWRRLGLTRWYSVGLRVCSYWVSKGDICRSHWLRRGSVNHRPQSGNRLHRCPTGMKTANSPIDPRNIRASSMGGI